MSPAWDAAAFRRAATTLLTGASDPAALAEALRDHGRRTGDPGLGLSAMLAGVARPIRRWGDDAQRRLLLDLVGDGAIAASAHAEPRNVQATRHGDRWRLAGRKARVVLGGAADLYVVTARAETTRVTFLVPSDQPGLRAHPLAPGASVPLADLTLEGCDLPDSARLGGPSLADDVRRWERVLLLAPWLGVFDTLLVELRASLRDRIVGDHPLARSQLARAAYADLLTQHELGARLHARAAQALATDGPEMDIAIAALFLTGSLDTFPREATRLSGDLASRFAVDAALCTALVDPDRTLRPSLGGALLEAR